MKKMIHSHTEMISAEDFINNIKNNKAAFLVIIDQSNFFKDLHVIHMMNIIIKSFTSEELSLSKEYESYANIFSAEKIIKYNELEDAEHLINLLSEKNSSYELIYNLSAQELNVLQEYIYSSLDKN